MKILPGAIVCLFLAPLAIHSQPAPTVLADVDHRQSTSLNGDWHYIVDPYQAGLYTFHHEIRKDGFFQNRVAKPGSNNSWSTASAPRPR